MNPTGNIPKSIFRVVSRGIFMRTAMCRNIDRVSSSYSSRLVSEREGGFPFTRRIPVTTFRDNGSIRPPRDVSECAGRRIGFNDVASSRDDSPFSGPRCIIDEPAADPIRSDRIRFEAHPRIVD